MQVTLNQLLAFAPEIHKTNVEKGFWPENRNKGEQLMLVVSELGEAMEAHRKGRDAQLTPTDKDVLDGHILAQQDGWKILFEGKVKDTTQDELADAIIRYLDWFAGWGIKPAPITTDYKSSGNFGHDLMLIVSNVAHIFNNLPVPGNDERIENLKKVTDSILGEGALDTYPLVLMVAFCNWWNIDILPHVRWKMQYNKTRPYKHGKSY